MSSDLRETSLDKLVALNSEYYYYSLPLAASNWVISTGCRNQ